MESKINYESAIKNIRSELKSYLVNGNLKSVVLGVSGGIDSTLCALLAKPVCEELNIPLIGRSLPTKSNSKGENSRAKRIGNAFCTEFKEVAINKFINFEMMFDNFDVYPEEDDHKDLIRQGNIKARTRMILLYDLAQAENGIVLSTDNYTELLLGFWTLHGDEGDYGMVQNLWKTEVYEMSKWIAKNELKFIEESSIVIEVIEADATDGLGITKSDLDQIMPGWEGSSKDGYEKVDDILAAWLYAKNPDKDFYETKQNPLKILKESPVIQRHLRTQFKRNNPYNIPRKNITDK